MILFIWNLILYLHESLQYALVINCNGSILNILNKVLHLHIKYFLKLRNLSLKNLIYLEIFLFILIDPNPKCYGSVDNNFPIEINYIPNQKYLTENVICFEKQINSGLDVFDWECKLFSTENLLIFLMYADLLLHIEAWQTELTHRILTFHIRNK
jgi:hypothetical protein